MLFLQHFVLSHPRYHKNIRRNTGAQKKTFHLPAVNSPGFCQGDGVAATGGSDLIHSVYETSFFDVFFWIYPEPALILGWHYFKQRNLHNFVAVALAEDIG